MLLDDVMSDGGIGVGLQAEQCCGAECVASVVGHDIQQHGQGFRGGDFAKDLCERQALARVGFRVADSGDQLWYDAEAHQAYGEWIVGQNG